MKASRRSLVSDAFAGVFGLAAVVVVVLGFVQCAGGTDGDPDQPGAAPTPVPTPTPPAEGAALAVMCESPGPLAGAAAYQGEGPHPLVVFEGPAPYLLADHSPRVDVLGFPNEWRAESDAEAQLIVCVDSVAGPKVGTCVYEDDQYEDDMTIGVHETTYTVHVYEAATGRLLDEEVVIADEYSCSEFSPYTGEGGLLVWREGDYREVPLPAGVLEELVTPPVTATV